MPVEVSLRAVSLDGSPSPGFYLKSEGQNHPITFELRDLPPPLQYNGPAPIAIYRENPSEQPMEQDVQIAAELPVLPGGNYLLLFSGKDDSKEIRIFPYPETEFEVNSARFINTTSFPIEVRFGETEVSLAAESSGSDGVRFDAYLHQERSESLVMDEGEATSKRVAYSISSIPLVIRAKEDSDLAESSIKSTRQIDLRPNTRLLILIYFESDELGKTAPKLNLRVLYDHP
jgi:hypothetical protein